MIRVLVISHASVNEPHRAPYDKLASHSGFHVDLVAPTSIPVGAAGRKLCDPAPKEARYVLHTVPLKFEHAGRFIWFVGLRKLIRQTQPDVVFIEHDPGSVPVLQAAFTGVKTKRIAFSVENILRNRWLDAGANLRAGRLTNALRDSAVALLGSMGAAATDGLACISLEGVRIFRDAGEWRKPIAVVPLGTDTHRFRPLDSTSLRADLGLAEAFVVGYCGRLVPEKGVHLLVEALPQMPAQTKLLLDMFKNFDPGSYAAKLLDRAEELGVRDRIVTIDVAHSQIPQYMNCCDVVVLPSLTSDRWKEQFGRVLPEAMACGVPVIGSSSGNIPDMIGEAGVIVPEGSPDAIATAVTALADDADRRQLLQRAGRKRVEELFSVEAQVSQMRALFTDAGVPAA